MKRHFLLFLIVSMINVVLGQEDTLLRQNNLLSPFSFGLAEAESDSARFEVLYKTHAAALNSGMGVDYSNVGTLSIEIPSTAKPIPLTDQTDFCGLELHVKNVHKTCFLFELSQTADTITIDKNLFGGQDFSSITELAEGTHLLILQDDNLWVNKRKGSSYGATRKDVLFVRDGQALNTPVAPYTTDSSKPKCFYCPATDTLKYVKNITFTRDTASTYKTKFIRILRQNNVLLEKVFINTPASTMTADGAITISDCANITFQDVSIKGTYSRTDYYGYGIEMNNVWNSQFIRLYARANWGVFGTNNINEVLLVDCDINRFDIHCYGKNVTLKGCKFTKLYNQFSSVFGNVVFDGCSFKDFVPVLLEPSYNAYTGFDLVFKDCIFDVTATHNYLISAGYLNDQMNVRPELAKKCWPNISIKNMVVNVPDNVGRVVVFNVRGTVSKKYAVGYISKLKIDGLKFNYSGSGHSACLSLCNTNVTLSKSFACTINDLDILPFPNAKITQAKTKYYYPASVSFNLYHDKAKDVMKISNSRLNYNVNTNAAYNIHYTKCTLGLVRYNSSNNKAKRYYKDCEIFLNCCDDRHYFLDNHATFDNCLFVPCSPYMMVNFYGNNNDVTITNCRSNRKTTLIYKGRLDNADLKHFTLKGGR